MMQSRAEPTPAFGILLCDDLLFASKVTATARAQGFALKVAASLSACREQLACGAVCCLIVDLVATELEIHAFMQSLKELGPQMPRVVAFGSHVDTAKLRAARDAGCDEVMPRSQFAEVLESQLGNWLTGKSPLPGH